MDIVIVIRFIAVFSIGPYTVKVKKKLLLRCSFKALPGVGEGEGVCFVSLN